MIAVDVDEDLAPAPRAAHVQREQARLSRARQARDHLRGRAHLLEAVHGRQGDHHVQAALDAGKRDVLMQMGRCGDGDGIDAVRKQSVDVRKRPATNRVCHAFATFRVRINNADEPHPRQIGKNAGVIAAHDADANDADAQNPICTTFGGVHHG